MTIKCSACSSKAIFVTECSMDISDNCIYIIKFKCVDCFSLHNIQTTKDNYLLAMDILRQGGKQTTTTAQKVYISGPMSDYEEFNRPAFNRASARITANGNIPLNPAILPDGLTQPEYMDICMAMLRCADKVLMLPDWEKSAGARVERALADKLGLTVSFIKKVTFP